MTAADYRNIVVNVVTPRTTRDRTAKAILDALTPGPLSSIDLDAQITARGGHPSHKGDAVKALRNLGYAITARKARHKSVWSLDGAPSATEAYRNRVVREGYSQIVSTARLLAGALAANPTDLQLAESQRHAQHAAIGLGTDPALGLTLAEVVAELAPL